MEKDCYFSSDRTTPPIFLWSSSVWSLPTSCRSSSLWPSLSQRFLHPYCQTETALCVCIVCGWVACARVAIPSDCQRGSWEIYCMGQTTGFLYHFSRFLFFSPIQESDYGTRFFLWLYSSSSELSGLSSLELHFAYKCAAEPIRDFWGAITDWARCFHCLQQLFLKCVC